MSATYRHNIAASRRLLTSLKNKTGLYIITSADQYDPHKTMLVKIGIAKNLMHRLDSYLLYWPKGYYIFAYVLTNTNVHARRTEKSIHNYLVTKNRYHRSPHSHDEEWFEMTEAEIRLLCKLLKANKTTRVDRKQIFMYYKITELKPSYILANPQIGQHRTKGMSMKTKALLENNCTTTHLLRTDRKKPAKQKGYSRRSKRPIRFVKE